MYTIAIGDIHGMASKLSDLLQAIDNWVADHIRGQKIQFIFLGDYIDRGPNSLAVIRRLRQLQKRAAICLRGNHEQWMIEAVQSELHWQRFIMNGGEATLRFMRSMLEFHAVRTWTETLPTFYEDDLRYYVHAGIDPDLSLEQQNEHTRLTISVRFTRSRMDFLKYIVHGHTPTTRFGAHMFEPDVRENRYNLDADAARGGRLSAAIFFKYALLPQALISI